MTKTYAILTRPGCAPQKKQLSPGLAGQVSFVEQLQVLNPDATIIVIDVITSQSEVIDIHTFSLNDLRAELVLAAQTAREADIASCNPVWTDEEIRAIEALARSKDMTPAAVVRQAVRQYDAIAQGLCKVEWPSSGKAPPHTAFTIRIVAADAPTA